MGLQAIQRRAEATSRSALAGAGFESQDVTGAIRAALRTAGGLYLPDVAAALAMSVSEKSLPL